MKAWQFVGTHQPLVLNDIDEPVAAAGEVVLEVRAAGMCHSDVGTLEQDDFVPFPLPVPVTLGHEIAGVISSIGEGVTGWSPGDRVAVYLGPLAPGFARNGGYQARVAIDAADLVRIPDEVSFEHAAIAADAGVTAYLAVANVAAVASGDKVGVIGFGGLGQIGAQIAIALGAQVYVAEVNRDAWSEAREAGALEVVEDITQLANEGLDVVVDFAGFGTTAGAIEAVKIFGTVVQIGLGSREATIDVWSLVTKRVRLVGALGGAKSDLEGVLALLATGKLNPRITRVGFDDIPDALARFSRGETRGRTVAVTPL